MKIAGRAILLMSMCAALGFTSRAASAIVVPAPRENPPSADAGNPPPTAVATLPSIAVATLPSANAATPPSADEVVRQACAEAAATHKKVMVIFHASWCTWCHKLDTMMASAECKPLFDQSFVICHLDIAESPDKRDLENPGAEELYAKYANQNCGIPFFLIMNADGTVIADSRIKAHGVAPTSSGDNIGYPGSRSEMEYYLRTLRATTSLTPAQLKIIKEKFTKK
ncbi:MAG TPA: thioredoxin family protein [Puia sp.]|nr:thioredoxin family protein [Puia sp.]